MSTNVRWRKELNLPPAERLEDYQIDTILKVRQCVPELAHLSAHKIAKLWEAFSDDRCAGWLIEDDERVKEFWEWCNEDTFEEESDDE